MSDPKITKIVIGRQIRGNHAPKGLKVFAEFRYFEGFEDNYWGL